MLPDLQVVGIVPGIELVEINLHDVRDWTHDQVIKALSASRPVRLTFRTQEGLTIDHTFSAPGMLGFKVGPVAVTSQAIAGSPGGPEWQDDEDVTECPLCSVTFKWNVRKHHCRACGRVVCSKCSKNRGLVTPDKEARMCDACHKEACAVWDRLMEPAEEGKEPSVPVMQQALEASHLRRVAEGRLNAVLRKKTAMAAMLVTRQVVERSVLYTWISNWKRNYERAKKLLIRRNVTKLRADYVKMKHDVAERLCDELEALQTDWNRFLAFRRVHSFKHEKKQSHGVTGSSEACQGCVLQ